MIKWPLQSWNFFFKFCCIHGQRRAGHFSRISGVSRIYFTVLSAAWYKFRGRLRIWFMNAAQNKMQKFSSELQNERITQRMHACLRPLGPGTCQSRKYFPFERLGGYITLRVPSIMSGLSEKLVLREGLPSFSAYSRSFAHSNFPNGRTGRPFGVLFEGAP